MTRAALLLMATTLAISTAAAKDSESPPDSLATRIEETRDGDLAVNDLAILLLEAEMDAVTAWLKDVSLASNEATSP
ncbi:hypothetical protein OAF93_01715, partial [Planctomycetota bacterium]|nr:hypothetical protein [Planctomycetota bacterium]